MGDQNFIVSNSSRHVKARPGCIYTLYIIVICTFATTNQHRARVVGYGAFSLCVMHKEGMCASSGGINRLMMMMMALDKLRGTNESMPGRLG
jgi:hypothetical protein